MEYVDEHGQPAYGVVWSPGPMPGTVWVLPESGASKSSALVVKVASRDQVPHAAVQRYLERNLSDYIGRFKYAPRLPAKAWHEAIGYDPREVVAEDALALAFDAETAAETPPEPVGEPVPASAPSAAPVAAETSPEPVTVPMAASAQTVQPSPAGHCSPCPESGTAYKTLVDHVQGQSWSPTMTSCGSCPDLDMVNNDDQLCHVSRVGHDPQGLRRVRVPSRSWMRRRRPARPRHPVQTPCPRPLAGHAAHPCPRSQMLVRPPPPRRHHACSIRVCSSRWRPEHRPERVEQCRGPTASGPERRRHPRSGPPGAGPNGVRDELSLRSPTPDGWPRRAASYRKLVAGNW